jgi:hypothetical protein
MALRIELPDDLVHDLEQEVARQQLSLAELIREALAVWRTSRKSPPPDREEAIRVLQERGLFCELPESLTTALPMLTTEELEHLATRAAQGGPLSELIVRERRGEV